MQYGIKSNVFKDTNKRAKIKSIERLEPIKLIIIFLAAFLLSRVVIYVNKENVVGMLPFGLAFLAVVLKEKNQNEMLVCSVGGVIGYLTIGKELGNVAIYIITTLIVLLITFILSNSKRSIGNKSILLIYFITYIIYGVSIGKYDFSSTAILALIYSISMLPIFFIISYGLSCMENYNTNYYFNVEEMISVGVIGCLMIAGIGDIAIVGISLRDVMSMFFVILVGYIGGAANGGSIGIAMGLILGISSGSILEAIGYYGLIGLVSGLFKETGKIFSFLSAGTLYIILSLYMQGNIGKGIIEVIIGGVIFLLVPKKVFTCLDGEMNLDTRNDKMNEIHMNQIKNEFAERVEKLGKVLNNVSMSVANLSGNDALSYKDKSSALVDSLADRICTKCDMCGKCWEHNFHNTYNCFEKIIRGKEDNYVVFPKELEKKCKNKYELLSEVDSLILNMNAEAVNREKLEESRRLISEHISTMALNVNSMIKDFKRDIGMCTEIEKNIRRELNKNSVKYNDVFCYNDRDGKIKIKISMDNCSGGRYCIKNVLPIVNLVVKRPMMIGKEGCSINPNNEDCTVTIKEMPKYSVTSYVGISIKEGEEYTGDTYNFGQVNGGKYLTILSDGMGSGPEASKESKMTVDLIEKFMDCGFGIDTALNTVNSIMAMKFDEDEKFSTLDMNSIDLYNGEISFIKVGATSSFIKRGKEIIKISSNMPPFGLVDKIEIESIDNRVRNGDVIVTLSDGVLDVDKAKVGDSEWIEKYLLGAGNNPKDLAIDIIEESKRISKGSIKDDMTVIVSKVTSLY